MAELSLKQITDKLNSEFAGEGRKLIFWYDDNAEFEEDINTLELEGAKVYILKKDNQFETKYFLERVDRETNYLLYAPFSRPDVRDNHLEDILLYSKEFFADRASLLIVDLGIDSSLKPYIQKYIKFFGSKDRTKKFYDLEIEHFSKEVIEVGIMSVLSKTKVASFEEVVRTLLTEGSFEENKILEEFRKYDLNQPFWQLCEVYFGYSDPSPTIEKLVMTMFVTYTDRYLKGEIPKEWEGFISYKSGNIIAFMNNLMNSVLYKDRYDEISEEISRSLNAPSSLKNLKVESLLEVDNFKIVDLLILNWINDRLLSEDTGARLDNMNIEEICIHRLKKHFGSEFSLEYNLLENAYHLINASKYTSLDGASNIFKEYISKDFKIDNRYRRFYYSYDKLEDASSFEKLKDLIEAIYTNVYLGKLLPKWNETINSKELVDSVKLQRNFFKDNVKNSKDKLVVIISDALRYETGNSLYKKVKEDPKSTVKLDALLGVLPSYTRLGMAALLPHQNLEITDDYKVLVDGCPCDDLKQREAILKKHIPNSRCVQYDDIKSMKRDDLREIFTGMEVVYVYHNQIDARGDKLNTENEVFDACEEAIEEIYSLIRRLSTTANTQHFMVTADHGFLYKRDKLVESDKIGGASSKDGFINRRFIISESPVVEDGVAYTSLGWILGNDDNKVVSYPISSNVFKVSGGGQNFVHGGSSPQELIVPLLDIKMEKGYVETKPAQITLVSMVQKITNLITSLDFFQSEPVSDIVKSTVYKIYFISETGEKISNENIYVADKKDKEGSKRIFRLRFNLKNKQYDRSTKYYLVAYDDKNNLEVMRHEVTIDMAFANDFGFNV